MIDATPSRAPVLPDVLAPGLRLVFCGSAAGRKSAELGAYYAGPGNKFWPTLYEIGLTPRHFRPQDRKSTRLNSVTNAHIVCRLLLEKKKTKNTHTNSTHL